VKSRNPSSRPGGPRTSSFRGQGRSRGRGRGRAWSQRF
jgi:hypothetical protein